MSMRLLLQSHLDDNKSQLTGEQEDVVEYVGLVASVLSITGSVFIIIFILYFKKWENFRFKLVMMLSISDVIYSSIGTFYPSEDSLLCIGQSICTQFFSTVSYCWVLAIAITLYQVLVLDETGEDDAEDQKRKERKMFVKYCLYISGFATFTCILPFIGGTYGKAGAWCWIDDSTLGSVWRYLVFYVPVWLSMLVLIFMYYRIVKKINADLDGADDIVSRGLTSVVRRLMAYPLIFFCSYIPATILRIQNSISPDTPIVWLYAVAVFALNVTGFFNAFAYGLNDSLRRDLQKCFSSTPVVEHEELEEDGSEMNRMHTPVSSQDSPPGTSKEEL